MATYRYQPLPGTMARRILDHIQANPGVSTSGIIRKLDLNPTPARACIRTLLRHGLVEDSPNDDGHHAYTATARGTRA